jgi:hypothetical protein
MEALSSSAGRSVRSASQPIKTRGAANNGNRFLKDTLVAPRAIALTNRFPGKVRVAEFEDLLGAIWSHLLECLTGPVGVKASDRRRTVTFMGAVRFIIDKSSGKVSVSQLGEKNKKVEFLRDDKKTVIDLPVRLNGFWLDPFLVPWRGRIGECLIDHHATGSDVDWYAAIKLEL